MAKEKGVSAGEAPLALAGRRGEYFLGEGVFSSYWRTEFER